jgi:protein-tyrosine phosphatase
LEFVVEKGVTTFVNLTTRQDRLEPYVDLLPGIGAGLKHLSYPIPDMGVPESDEVMDSILEAIRAEMEAGRVCYVHCWGGIGRTGTVIGCYFRDQGMGGDEALSKVQQLYAAGMPKVVRHPHSPQTKVQWDYVRNWCG